MKRSSGPCKHLCATQGIHEHEFRAQYSFVQIHLPVHEAARYYKLLNTVNAFLLHHQLIIDNIEQYLAVPGNSLADVPPDQFGRLRPVDRQKFLRGQRDQDEMTIMEQVARNPALVAEGDWLERHRNKMTHATFVKLLADRSKPDRILSATIDADQLEATLTRNGFDTLAAPPRGDKQAAEQSLFLRNNIKTMIDAEQTRIGRALSRPEKQAIMDRAILDKVYMERSWSRDPQVPFSSLGPDELQQAYVTVGNIEVMLRAIPEQRIEQIRNELKSLGLPTNIKSIAEAWVRAGAPQ